MSEVDTRVQQGTDGQSRGPRPVASPADLAAAREARGMSQIDVSQRIKLQVRQVAALEEGNWDLLPGRAFARGALRSYGKLIQADVTPLLEMIGTTDVTAQMPRHALSSGVGPVTKSVYERESRSGTWLWVIGGLVAAGALIYHFGSGPGGLFDRDGGAGTTTTIAAPVSSGVEPAPVSGAGSPASGSVSAGTPGPVGTGPGAGGTAATTAPAADPAAPMGSGLAAGGGGQGAAVGSTSSSPADGHPATAAGNGPSSAASAASVASAPSAPSAPPAASAPSAPSAPSAAGAQDPAGGGGAAAAGSTSASPAPAAASASAKAASVPAHPGSIHFLPAEDSWVRVTDATGRKLHEALIPAGTPLTVQGKPPYKLRMGNARHLQIHYEGKEVRVPSPNEKNITLLELP